MPIADDPITYGHIPETPGRHASIVGGPLGTVVLPIGNGQVVPGIVDGISINVDPYGMAEYRATVVSSGAPMPMQELPKLPAATPIEQCACLEPHRWRAIFWRLAVGLAWAGLWLGLCEWLK